MARRILLTIEYDGTAYSGWQRQYNGCCLFWRVYPQTVL